MNDEKWSNMSTKSHNLKSTKAITSPPPPAGPTAKGRNCMAAAACQITSVSP
jgi:hypothetical protein